jgi:Putative Actinobacterial Holin-X, holin superfamily III
MAILQALLTLIGRSAGKILNAVFGWAVRALFGFTTGAERALLTVLVAGAAIWPLLLVGIAAPRVAAFALAFVPIPESVPDGAIRAGWLALAGLVPVGLGIALAARQPPGSEVDSLPLRMARGFPLTIGIAVAFWMSVVSVPIVRIATALRGRADSHVPLVTPGHAYRATAETIRRVLAAHGFEPRPREPDFWVRAPLAVMRRLGGPALRGYVPERVAHFVGPRIDVTLYPTGVLLRGRERDTALAHGLVLEALTACETFQTTDAEAQKLETEIRRVWQVLGENPDAHVASPWLASRVADIAGALAESELAYDDWQIVYRQLLQLDRALHGEPQLLAEKKGDDAMTERIQTERPPLHGNGSLSTVELLREIGSKARLLAEKEVELARVELKSDFDAELAMVKRLAVAGVFAITALNLAFVAGAFALAERMEGWVAAAILAGVALAIAIVAGLVGWRRRVKEPLAVTRETLQEDVRWAKERLA